MVATREATADRFFEVSKEGSTVWAKVGDSLYKFEPNVSEEELVDSSRRE